MTREVMSAINAMSDELQLAHRLADAADAISLARYLALDLVVETKPDATPVTDADRAVEKAIRAILESERPSDLIIGEEFGGKELLESAKPGTRFWIIDPIDGTKNFLRGVPTWATLIASGRVESAQSLGDPTGSQLNKVIDIGVVSSPSMGRRWWAERGFGAYLTENFAPASPLVEAVSPDQRNPGGRTPEITTSKKTTRRISVSKVASLSDASLSYSDLLGWEERRDVFISLLDEVWRTRALGDFLSHMLVAEGAVDIAAEPSLALWDMAALAVIVEEAGGRYSSLDGLDGPFGGSGLASNGDLHEEVLKRLNSKNQSSSKNSVAEIQ